MGLARMSDIVRKVAFDEAIKASFWIFYFFYTLGNLLGSLSHPAQFASIFARSSAASFSRDCGNSLDFMEHAMSVVEAIKSLKEGIDTVQDFKNKHEIAQAINTIQNDYMGALERNTQLMEENRELRTQLEHQENWEKIEPQFELFQFSSEYTKGGVVYRPIKKTNVVDYYLCTQCFENKKKSILQYVAEYVEGRIYNCPNCSNKVVEPTPPPRSHVGVY